MEQQGATVARGDDENSQAEGFADEAVGGVVSASVNTNATNTTPANVARSNPHYENIYEAIEPYAAAAAAPAELIPVAQIVNLNNNASNNANSNNLRANSMSFRNELYDRTSGYDIPRQRRNHIDLNTNRLRYRPKHQRQRSFDDTESYHNYIRYENIYEQIHEEPIYSRSTLNGGRVYGHLDVIGHGIGRIERHLSSSCGNIDHYNLGGHYAVLGHSHLGTMGHIRLNATNPQYQNNKTSDDSVKSSYSFFSCLAGENSQSMNNIYRTSNPRSASQASNPIPTTSNGAGSSRTGTIPKQPIGKTTKPVPPKPTNQQAEHTSSLNRISKSSLQWLVMNKWLPLWIGGQPQGRDYKVIDFNFMFSRNCEGCGEIAEHGGSLVHINGQAQMHSNDDFECQYSNVTPASSATSPNINMNNGTGGRVLRNNPNIVRLRECDHASLRRPNPYQNYERSCPRNYMRHDYDDREHNPFRNWELNTEHNTFRPAGGRVRNIHKVDGGFNRNKESKPFSSSRLNIVNVGNSPLPASMSIARPQPPTDIPHISSSSNSGHGLLPGSGLPNTEQKSLNEQKTNDTASNNNDEQIYYQNSECTEDDQEECGSSFSFNEDDDI